MLRNITAILMAVAMAIPSVGVPSLADARPLGHRFCQNGVRDNNDLADRLAEARRLEIQNHEAAGSRNLRGCTNGIKFLAAFRNGTPEVAAELTDIEALIRYLREGTEVVTVTEDTRFMSSCHRGNTADASDVVMRCQPESLRGVRVLRDKRSGRYVMVLRCANPGLSPLAPPGCGYVWVHVMRSADISAADMALPGSGITPAEEAECPVGMHPPVEGGTTLSPAGYIPMDGRLPSGCDFSAVTNNPRSPGYGMRVYRQACVHVTVDPSDRDGVWVAIRVHYRHASDMGLRVFVCARTADGRQSFAQGAQFYTAQPDRSVVAVIGWSPEDVPAGLAPREQFLHWQERRM